MDVIIKEVGILVKYPHIGKSYVLSDEEFLRRRIDVKMTSIYSSDRESGEELMRRLEVLKGLKATGQLEEEDRRGLLLSPPREEIGLLERQRQRIKKI